MWRVWGEGRGVYRVLVGNLRERDNWVDPGIDGRIILRWIFKKWDVGIWTGYSWLRIGTGGGHLCYSTYQYIIIIIILFLKV